MTCYSEILGFKDLDLERLLEYGRANLHMNDLLMCAAEGQDKSIYRSGIRDSIEVAMVNLCFAVLRQDWKMVGLALAALELSLDRPDIDMGRKVVELLRGQCGEINCILKAMTNDDLNKLIEIYPQLGGPGGA